MVIQKFQAYLNLILRPPSYFQGLGPFWLLCLANLGLVTLSTLFFILIESRFGLFILFILLIIVAMLLVILFPLKVQQFKFTAKKQQIESEAFEALDIPLLILTPNLFLCYGNKKAQNECWWASDISLLKKAASMPESNASLKRLLEAFSQKEEVVETLKLQKEKGEEVWRIQAFPLGKNSLWKCENITEKKDEESKLLHQLKTLTLFLDHATDGLFSLNEKGVILFCNEKFAHWLGYTRDGLISTSLSKLLVKPRGQDPIKLSEIRGRCDFITSSSRIKSAFLEQTQIPSDSGFITHSVVNLYTPFANHSDLSKVLEMTPLPMICLDHEGKIQESNILFKEKFWLESLPLRGVSFLDLVTDFQKEEVKNTLQAFLNRNHAESSLEIHFNDARESIVSAYFAPLSVKNQNGIFIQFHDITEQKRFESQLAQSQKMQAVGQLAGGIAHDFNNLLTAMIGFCDLMLLRHTPGDQTFIDVMQIKQNANRAANLVRQLLAFSRQQTLQPKVLDITECLAELSALLRRLIGSNIELKIKHVRDLGLVLVDQGQFEQVIINMVVNARDAIERGGMITITTHNVELKRSKRYGHDVIPAGSYVVMEVSDTGAGIKPEHLDRIFEPFFSTKEVGSGTGLGLSTVYGIVKQTGGFIQVDSKVGEGTTFTIYLPRYTAEYTAIPAISQKQEKIQPQDLTGSSTILLVEDEDAVRLFSSRALRSKGYKVIEAINGEEALELMKSNKEKIDLIISDVVMPQMDGPTFINELNKLNLTPKVLFISGYTEDAFHNQIREDAFIHFLAKPFNLSDLAIRVKEILGEDVVSIKQVS